MAKEKKEGGEEKKRTRTADKFANFRRQFGLLSLTEMAKAIDCNYQKQLRLSKIGNDILTPRYGVVGSEKMFYHKDDIKAVGRELRRLTNVGGEGLTQNDMAKELGLHPSFFAKAVAIDPELKPENGEYYTKAEKGRICETDVEGYLFDLRNNKGLSIQTSNNYLRAIKTSFTGWCGINGRPPIRWPGCPCSTRRRTGVMIAGRWTTMNSHDY